MSKLFLEKELETAGYHHGRERFEEVIQTIRHALQPDWTDDFLLCNPTQALRFVIAVQLQTTPAIHESIICQTLLNMRKRGSK
jgi:hypothetical protein